MIQEADVRKIVEEKIAGTDIFIVEIKAGPGKINVSLDAPAGITIGQCTEVSRHLYQILDTQGILETTELEVGSPGMDEPLKVYPQYERRLGKKVKVITADGNSLEGTMTEVKPNGITLEESITKKEKNKKTTETVSTFLPFTTIKETTLILSFNKKQ